MSDHNWEEPPQDGDVSIDEFEALEATTALLEQNVQKIIDNEGSYVTAREVETATDLLERTVTSAVTVANKTADRVNKITQALNSLSLRFRAFASNEQAITAAASVLPSSGEKEAMAGTSDVPSNTNRYVTNADSRLTDNRTPLAHASTHALGGTDVLLHSNLSGAGTLTHAQIDTQIDAIETTLTAFGIDITDLTTDVTAIETQLANQTLDDITDGSTYVKTTIAEKARIVTQAVFDALGAATLPSGTNPYITKDEADAIYQVIGTYVTLAYLGAIGTDLVPDVTEIRSLGSPTKKWLAIHVSGNTIYVGGVALSIIDGELAVDGIKVVNATTVNDEIETHPDVIAGKDHSALLHDYDYIKANTVGALPSRADLNNFIANHASGTDHDFHYYTKSAIDQGLSPIFATLATIANLSAGNFDVPWNALINVPNLADSAFKGVVSSFINLPLTGTVIGQLYGVRTSPGNSNLAAVYIVVNPSGLTQSTIYRPVFDATLVTHNSLAERTATDAHPQYMTEPAFDARLFLAGTIASLRSSLGITGANGILLTTTLLSHLTTAYNHTFQGGNVHSTTAADVGAIDNDSGSVQTSHLNVGLGGSQINSDELVARNFQGATYKFTTPSERANISTAYTHSINGTVHTSSVEKAQIFTSGSDTNIHHHASDRALANATGQLDALTKLSNLNAAVDALAVINALQTDTHTEAHTIESHSDTSTTGNQLDTLQTLHSDVKTAHNRDFGTSGSEGGSATLVARSDHKHDTRYAKLVDFNSLANPGGGSILVDWSNLANVPQTVGDARVFATNAVLLVTTPLQVGEQVVVLDYNGSGDWGVYIAVGVTNSDWSLLSSEDMGLLFAPLAHIGTGPTTVGGNDHDVRYVLKSELNGSVSTQINTYFATPPANQNIPSDVNQAKWNLLADTTYPAHDSNLVKHITIGERTNWNAAKTHADDSSIHLSAGEKTALTTNFNTSVYATTATINAVSQSLTNHIEDALVASSLANILGELITANATPANMERLFNGSDVSTGTVLHNHNSVYSELGHTHDAGGIEILNLESTVDGYGFIKTADFDTLFSGKSTDDLSEGLINKYLTDDNLGDLNRFTVLESHANDSVANRKHLTDADRNALTQGLGSITGLHSHAGYHYVTDSQIRVGIQRTSLGDPTPIGSAGLISTARVAVTDTAPSLSSSTGNAKEIRVDDNFLYVKTSTDWKRIALSSF